MELLALSVLLTGLSVLTQISQWAPFYVLFAVVGLGFAPGYSLLASLYPKKSALSSVDRFVLSVPLSFAIASLVGMCLLILPWGFRITPLQVSLTIVVWVLSILAVARRNRLSTSQSFMASNFRWQLPSKQSSRLKWYQLVIAGLFTTFILVWMIHQASFPSLEPISEFYILDLAGGLSDFPTELVIGKTQSLRVVIRNSEQGTETYFISATLENHPVGNEGPIVLRPGQIWNGIVNIELKNEIDSIKDWNLLQIVLTKQHPDIRFPLETHLWVKIIPDSLGF